MEEQPRKLALHQGRYYSCRLAFLCGSKLQNKSQLAICSAHITGAAYWQGRRVHSLITSNLSTWKAAALPPHLTKRIREEGAIPMDVSMHDNTLRVSWTSLAKEDLLCPFFSQAVTKKLSVALADTVYDTSLDELIAVANEAGYLTPSGYIFHLSRCGSTLLGNMLHAVDDHLVLSEPPPLTSLLDWIGSSFSSKEALPALRAMVSCLGTPEGVPGKRFFIKLFSQNIHQIELLRAATPGVAELFLYRDPLEVLVANLNWPGQDWIWREEYTGLHHTSAVTKPIAELFARGIGLTLSAMLKHLDDRTVLFNYSELSHSTPEMLERAFGFSATVEQRTAMCDVMRWSSKDAFKERLYASDIREKREAAAPLLKDLINQFAALPYNALEERRLASRPSATKSHTLLGAT